MSKPKPRSSPSRRVVRRLSPALLVVAMVTALLGLGAPPAHAASKWNSGVSTYSTITNCPSIIWGTPYREFGIGAFVSYWGDQGSTPLKPATGETTYMSTYVLLVGSHCSDPYIFPQFHLPAGVQFDKTQPIECYYTPPGGGAQQKITHSQQCPQWSNVAADGFYASSYPGWNTGWPLRQDANGNNGAGWEFLVPIRATSQQSGSELITQLHLADGNGNQWIAPRVNFWTGPAPVTAPGAPTNVSANATSPTSARVTFNPPANNGGAAVTGYTARCESTNGGASQTATGSASPVNVSGLTPDKSYACDVRATNNVGSGSWSAKTGSFNTPPAATVPGTPANVSATVLSAKSARISFNPPANNGGSAVTGYRAQCFSTDGGTTRVKDGTSSPLTFTTLTPDKTYRCRVRATNAVGDGGYSAYTGTFRLPATVPERPTGVSTAPTSSTSATITFAAPADNGSAITTYKVQCTSTDGGATGYGNATASPVRSTRLTPGKTYRCRVQAVNGVGGSTWSVFSSPVTLPAG